MKKQQGYFYRFILTVSIIVASFSISHAQKSTKVSTPASSVINDSAFISKNIMDNIMEIQLNEMAEMKSNDSKLKNLAQQMASDHTQLLNDLQSLAKKRNMTFSMMDSVSGTTGSKMATFGSGTTGSSVGTAGSGATGSVMGSSMSGTSANATTSSTAGSSLNALATTKSRVENSDSAAMARGMEATDRSRIENRKGATDSAGGITHSSTSDSSAHPSGTGEKTAALIPGTTNPGAAGHTSIDTLEMTNISTPVMAAIDSLRSASGTQFNTLFVSQMLEMHEAKLAELQTAAIKLTDPELKQAVIKALPRVRMHRDMLAKMNKAASITGLPQQ